MKPPKQLGPKELQEQIHKIRITFTFKKVKNLEKDNSPPQLCLFLLFCFWVIICFVFFPLTFFYKNKN